MKYGALTLGQAEALGNMCGGPEGVAAILRGELEIKLVDTKMRPFSDHTGRRIPPRGMKARAVDANRAFHLEQPPLDYAARLARVERFLTNRAAFLPAADFEARCNAVLEGLKADKRTVNFVRGVHLPFALPKREGDYGTLLDEQLLPAVEASYLDQFPGRAFTNHRKGALANQVTVVEASRHDRLVQALAAGPVVGVYFSDALRGYSIAADIEQMDGLPDHILLAGAIEPAAAMIAYPDVLARDFNTPGMDCAAVRLRSRFPLCFRAFDDELDFNLLEDLGAGGCYSAGLVVLGQ